MRIKKLILENFRGFRREADNDPLSSLPIEVKFPEGNLCVIIGENGAGKTTILDALAISLTNLLTRAPLGHDPLIEMEDSEIIHHKNGFNFIEEDVNNDPNTNFSITHLDMEHESEEFFIQEKVEFPIIDGEKDFTKIKRDIDPSKFLKPILILKDQLSRTGFTNMPIIKHYDIGKIVIDNSTFRSDDFKEDRSLQFNQFYTYDGCLTKNLFDHKYFSFWFKDREDLENEFRLREQDDQRELNLEVIRLAMDTFLDIISEGLFFNLNITRQKKAFGIGTFSLTINKRGVKKGLKLSQLSAGEKAIVMLVADIARRIAIANPGLYMNEEGTDRNPDYAPNILQNATGIVLIDEIDLHLHPKWQRLVLPALTATFPNIQFIVTTHSASVLKSLNAIRTPALKLTKNTGIEIVLPEFFIKSFDEIYDEMFELPKDQKNTIERLK